MRNRLRATPYAGFSSSQKADNSFTTKPDISIYSRHLATPWQRTPAPDELLIDGVNHLLNGTDLSTDFQPPSTAVPEPSALVLLLSGMALVAYVRRKLEG